MIASQLFLIHQRGQRKLFRRHSICTQPAVHSRCRVFDQAKRMDDLLRHGLLPDAYRKMLQATLCLCTSVAIRGNGNISHGVMLKACLTRFLHDRTSSLTLDHRYLVSSGGKYSRSGMI